jgi:hypothetical protein
VPALLQAFARLVALKRLGVLLFVLAATLCASSPASALEPAQTKTRVWGFDFAEHNSDGLLSAATRGKHLGNRLALSEVASGCLLAAEGLEASSAANSALLRNQLISEEIAGGHAFGKHVIQQGEFPGITNRAEFASQIEEFLNSSSTVTRNLSNGRSAFWNDSTGTVLVRNPAAADGGTFFRPTDGINYFWKLK